MKLQKTFPYFAGKKVLYVHGFASAGSSNTVKLLQAMMPEATVLGPDLPIHPAEALDLLHEICATEKPALVVGTSMGGMYTEQLYGIDRICVNPALQMGETIRTTIGLGKITFQNPRKDGVQEFMLTKALQSEYADACKGNFRGISAEERGRVVGLFGLHDDVVHTYDLFAAHYPMAVQFDGGHRLTESALIHSVMPMVRRFHLRQTQTEPPVLYVHLRALQKADGTAVAGATHAFEILAQTYQTYIVAPQNARPQEWLRDNVGVNAYDRIILTNHPEMLYGDYYIDTQKPQKDVLGTLLVLGSEKFKSWDDFLDYFELLGGQ